MQKCRWPSKERIFFATEIEPPSSQFRHYFHCPFTNIVGSISKLSQIIRVVKSNTQLPTMEQANSAEIIALAASSPLPIPVGRDNKGLERGNSDEKENGVFGMSPRSLQGSSPQGSSPRELPFPYQALPVTTATITEHLTPALPVIECSTLSHEVSLVAAAQPSQNKIINSVYRSLQ